MPASRRTPVPQLEVGAARPRRVARRGEHVGTLAARLAVEDAPGLSVENDRPRPGLGVRQGQHAVPHLGPAQVDDLAPCGTR